jgi:putative spermidine/putrescine transport system permease protein
VKKFLTTMLPTFAPHQSIPERIWFFTLRSFNVLVLLFLVLPILVIVPLSFSDSSFLSYPMPGVSLRWYHNLIESDEWMRAAKNSFIIAPAATIVATVLGTLAAVGLNKAEFRGKALVMAVLISPMVVPVVVVGVGVYIFFAQIGLSETYLGLILAHAALGAPFVVTTVAATLQGFNHNLVRASLSLGASPLYTFFRITLPVIAPGLISGALFAFATSFDEVVITLFVAGPSQSTLPRQMFSGIRENISPTIAALATILIVFSTCLLLALEWLRGRSKAAAKY